MKDWEKSILDIVNHELELGNVTHTNLSESELDILSFVAYGKSYNKLKVLSEAEREHLQVNILDYNDFIKKNECEEITDTLLFLRSGVPAPRGLLSNEIFGITKDDRSNIFAYIDLGGWFLHPFCYKVWCRIDKRIRNIVCGLGHYKIDQDGYIVEVESGGSTGIDFLRKNINKIKIKDTGSRNRQMVITFLNKVKSKMFIDKFMVIPPFYRDVDTKVRGAVGTGSINKYYQSLLISTKAIKETQDYGLSIEDATCGRIQETILAISNAFFGTSKNKDDGIGLSGKLGIVRRTVMSKSADMGTRLVISAPNLKVESMDDLMIDVDHAGLPLAAAITNFKPFVMFHVKRFFENLFNGTETIQYYDDKSKTLKTFEPDDPLVAFSDDEIEGQIDKFIQSFSNRFEPVYIEDRRTGNKLNFVFKGRSVSKEQYAKGDILGNSSLINRDLTWCDVFYMAACEACKDKVILITRFPIDSYFNEFPSLIRVSSTRTTEKVYVDNTYYPFYPKIRQEDIGKDTSNLFIDTLSFSNLHLTSIVGDYDGDQCSVKGVWSEESNKELIKLINSKSLFLDLSGNNIMVSTHEAIQSIYSMTKVLSTDESKLTDPVF